MTGRVGQAGPVTSCIPALLRERAQLQPDDVAFTFVDYEQDWGGVADSLTWSQVYRRALGVAQALRVRGSIGDRAVILAPHGLDYIVAFLGALQAGLIAVPLSIPQGGSGDERVAAVLRDAAPAVILTTSSAVGSVKKYVNLQRGESAPLVVYVDWLDVDWRKDMGPGRESWPNTAYLQYTSGPTGQPAGVIVSHANLLANSQQVVCDYCDQRGKLPPPDTHVVSWLPFDHDMGLIMGICAPIVGGFGAVLMSPAAFLQRPARWMQLMARYRQVWSAAPNFGYELAARRTSDDDMAGLDLRHVLGIFDSGERIHPATLERFTKRFARLHLRDTVIRPSY
jgi:fatty acid CoA ligase FadD28